MQANLLPKPTQTFEGHAEQTTNTKAKIAYEASGYAVSNHFVDVNKMIRLAKAGAACDVSGRVVANHFPTSGKSSLSDLAQNGRLTTPEW